MQYWLFGLGVVIILITVGGLLFEYYVGNRAPLR
ncbi:MAG: aa3-type cytochrome oxidase subunit IV [Jatrophihabitans sp.]